MKNMIRFTFGLLLAAIMGSFLSVEFGWPMIPVTLGLMAIGTAVKLPKGALGLTVTYPTDCDDADPIHECSDCTDPELGRIRGIAFIKKDYTIADPTSVDDWNTGIESGDIIIVPMTRGTFDGGTPKEGPGYGDQATKYIGTDYSLTFFDPDYITNRDFYNTIKLYQNWKVAYKTETQVHLTDKVCQVLPKAPVADDITSEVVWEVMVKWSSQNEPTPYTAPAGVFICTTISA